MRINSKDLLATSFFRTLGKYVHHGCKLVHRFRLCASYQVFLRYGALHIHCQINYRNPPAFDHLHFTALYRTFWTSSKFMCIFGRFRFYCIFQKFQQIQAKLDEIFSCTFEFSHFWKEILVDLIVLTRPLFSKVYYLSPLVTHKSVKYFKEI